MTTSTGEMDDDIRLWILRILVKLKGQRKFLTRRGFSDDGLAEALGLKEIENEDGSLNVSRCQRKLLDMYDAAERAQSWGEARPTLSYNVRKLGELVALSEADCRILEFALCWSEEELLQEAFSCLGNVFSLGIQKVVAVVAGVEVSEARRAIGSNGTLVRSGLLKFERNFAGSSSGPEFLTNDFAQKMQDEELNFMELVKELVRPGPEPVLPLGAFVMDGDLLEGLYSYLKASLDTRTSGVNVLIYGRPGTGKTELVRALANRLGAPLYEVASEDEGGDYIWSGVRIRGFRAAQQLLARSRSLILFDEIEDIFEADGPSLFVRSRRAVSGKAWMNRLLETNPVPTFWLSNCIEGIDNAFIRRFDFVIEQPQPTRSRRKALLHGACGDFVSEASRDAIAESSDIAPAVIERCSRVAHVVKNTRPEIKGDILFTKLVDNVLTAQGYERTEAASTANKAKTLAFDPSVVNCPENLDELGEKVARCSDVRICIYGPPGTGKTAFGQWVARKLDKPILQKKASDLLSCWVGGTEKNIRKAFDEARQEGALLQLDEMDSFLQDRAGVELHWEATQVNEFLTQLEAFSGIFIGTTNLKQCLDSASLRRFDLKLEFSYLRPSQSDRLLRQLCELIKIPVEDAMLAQRFAKLDVLTPGDFANVLRQARFRTFETWQDVFRALASECHEKQSGARPIGFTAEVA